MLRERLDGSVRAGQEAAAANAPPGALLWLLRGERNPSSEALLRRLTGIASRAALCSIPAAQDRIAHPEGPPELRCCLLMLDAVPALRARLREASDLSPQWAALIGAWAELEALLQEEAPHWRRRNAVVLHAPRLDARMRQLLG